MGNEISSTWTTRNISRQSVGGRVGPKRKSGSINKKGKWLLRRLDWQLSSSPSVQKEVEERPSNGLAKRKWLSLLPLLMPCMCLMITDEIQCQWTAAEKSQQGWKWKPSGNPSHSPWVPPSLFYYMKCPNWLRYFSSCKTCTHAQQIYLKLFYNQQLNRRKLREKNQGYSFMHKIQPYN